MARWMDEHYVQPQATAQAISLLDAARQSGEPTLLFGSLVQLHLLSQRLLKLGFEQSGLHMRLPIGSLVGTGGGLKQWYPFSPAQIHQDILLQSVDLPLWNGIQAPTQAVVSTLAIQRPSALARPVNSAIKAVVVW